jgi:thiamine biosynthesis lipoprotein
MRRIVACCVTSLLVLILVGCRNNANTEYTKYSDSFFDCFDTLTQVVGYTKSEDEFSRYFEKIKVRFRELHMLFDKYNEYHGINNIKTINDNAGKAPVKVKKEIIDLILFSKDWYIRTEGLTNIAMGSVLEIWHQYREDAIYDPANAKIPPMDALLKAAEHTDINDVIVDEANSTVYLADKDLRLDVGAVAKGFATEIVAREIKEEGLESGIISPGGNIRVIGKPLDGVRERWGIGIQNPDKPVVFDEENLLDTIFVNDASVVSSGDYQRYYIVDGKMLHHLIDPETLMPAEYFRAVTVVTEDSGVADYLSTAIFLMPYEQGRQLIEGLDGVEAVWVMPNGSIEATEGMKRIMKSRGASGRTVE